MDVIGSIRSSPSLGPIEIIDNRHLSRHGRQAHRDRGRGLEIAKNVSHARDDGHYYLWNWFLRRLRGQIDGFALASPPGEKATGELASSVTEQWSTQLPDWGVDQTNRERKNEMRIFGLLGPGLESLCALDRI